MFHKGFTLIEILVVIVIITITSSIVAPDAYNGIKKFDKLFSKYKRAQMKNKLDYLSFITDSKCVLRNGNIYCNGVKYGR